MPNALFARVCPTVRVGRLSPNLTIPSPPQHADTLRICICIQICICILFVLYFYMPTHWVFVFVSVFIVEFFVAKNVRCFPKVCCLSVVCLSLLYVTLLVVVRRVCSNSMMGK